MVEKNDANFQSELDRQTYYADFLADMDKAGIDISDAIISQDMQAVSDGISDGIESIQSATVYDFSKLNETTQSQIRNYYSGLVSTANTEMRSAESQLSTSNAEFASYVNMWMQNSSGSYLAMTGNDEMQSALSSIVKAIEKRDTIPCSRTNVFYCDPIVIFLLSSKLCNRFNVFSQQLILFRRYINQILVVVVIHILVYMPYFIASRRLY